jgi:hypothetical protein
MVHKIWGLEAGQLRQEYRHTIFKTLLFYGNIGYAKAPQGYVIRTLPVLLQTARVRMLLARL